jgi:aspartyl-tRNA(Asn)/glutamyl-tRNA(Gln) amidotransferase subunit B
MPIAGRFAVDAGRGFDGDGGLEAALMRRVHRQQPRGVLGNRDQLVVAVGRAVGDVEGHAEGALPAWAKYCAGEGKAMGALVGAVMKASQGKADGKIVTALLEQKKG